MRVRFLSDPVECGHSRRDHCGLGRHIEFGRRRCVIARVRRMQDEGETDAGIVAGGGVRSPIVPVACRSALAALPEELDAVDRHIFRGSRVFHCRASAGASPFHNIHLNVLRKEVGPRRKRQIDAACII